MVKQRVHAARIGLKPGEHPIGLGPHKVRVGHQLSHANPRSAKEETKRQYLESAYHGLRQQWPIRLWRPPRCDHGLGQRAGMSLEHEGRRALVV